MLLMGAMPPLAARMVAIHDAAAPAHWSCSHPNGAVVTTPNPTAFAC